MCRGRSRNFKTAEFSSKRGGGGSNHLLGSNLYEQNLLKGEGGGGGGGGGSGPLPLVCLKHPNSAVSSNLVSGIVIPFNIPCWGFTGSPVLYATSQSHKLHHQIEAPQVP